MKRFHISALLVVLAIVPLIAAASSHREAPLITEDPMADNTDVYAFRSPDRPDTVTIIANYIPIQEPAIAPNYYNFSDTAIYEIHIDNDGDAVEDITYQFDFRTDVRNGGTFLYNTGPVMSLDSQNLNVRQFYTVNRVMGERRTGTRSSMGEFQVAPYHVGPKSTGPMSNYAALANAAVFNMGEGGRVFAGPRDDPFFVDIGAIGDLLTLRPIQQLHTVPPVMASAPGADGLRGFNVHTIAIQVPIAQLVSGSVPNAPTAPNAVIGIWATASRPRVRLLSSGQIRQQTLGGLTQVSRLGNPLVNEVVMPLAFKDLFNASQPSGDAELFNTVEAFRARILDPELANLIEALYNVDLPEAPRNDLVQVFLTGVPGLNQPPGVVPAEMLRLNVGIPPAATANRLGVIGGDTAGFPNGRRLGDDVVDIALRVVAGVLVEGFNKAPNNQLTDGVDSNERPFMSTFPYVAMPYSGFESMPHPNAGSMNP